MCNENRKWFYPYYSSFVCVFQQKFARYIIIFIVLSRLYYHITGAEGDRRARWRPGPVHGPRGNQPYDDEDEDDVTGMPEQSNDYRVVVFGAGGVGKSSLVLRFVKGTFRESYIPTIEDTYRQVISCNKNICTLQITDTTGSHQFPAMQRLSMSKGHAFILVYSCTSRQSLEELRPIWQVSGGQASCGRYLAVGFFSDFERDIIFFFSSGR